MTTTSETPAKRSHASPPQPGKCLTASAAPPHTAASFLPAIPRHGSNMVEALLALWIVPSVAVLLLLFFSFRDRIKARTPTNATGPFTSGLATHSLAFRMAHSPNPCPSPFDSGSGGGFFLAGHDRNPGYLDQCRP